MAKRVAGALREGQVNLERGYCGDFLMPVYRIEDVAPKVATNREDAKAYCIAHNIRLERIIHNF